MSDEFLEEIGAVGAGRLSVVQEVEDLAFQPHEISGELDIRLPL